jgi:hypothetical protein
VDDIRTIIVVLIVLLILSMMIVAIPVDAQMPWPTLPPPVHIERLDIYIPIVFGGA